jgi:hypothetical protein
MLAHLIFFLSVISISMNMIIWRALEAMADEDGNTSTPIIPAVASLLTVTTRAQVFLSDITHAEMDFATSTGLGKKLIETIPGRFSTPAAVATKPQPVVLPRLRMRVNYIAVACKHECAIVKHSRHGKHAHAVWTRETLIQRGPMLSKSRLCGIDTTRAAEYGISCSFLYEGNTCRDKVKIREWGKRGSWSTGGNPELVG